MKTGYPNLRNLSRMLRVIDVGCLTDVAETLGRSQQTISHSIKDLEEELGVCLFERTSLGATPTREALVLGKRVRQALQHLAQARAAAIRPERSGCAPIGLRIWDFNVSNQQVFIFLALCEQREAKRVAAKLNLDVSAVRKAVRTLEAQVGHALFEKAARGFLIPTEFAELLARQMQLALWEVRAAMDELTSLDGTIQGEIVIGTSPHAHPMLLPRIVSRLHVKCPKLKLTLRNDSYDNLERALSCREIDFILGSERSQPTSPDVVAHPLLTDRLEILARADHPLAAAQLADIRLYLQCAWVLPPPHVPMRQRFSESLRNAALIEPEPAFETGDREIIRGLLRGTDCLALALRCESAHEISHGGLCFLPRPAELEGLLNTPVALHITHPVAATRSPSAQVFFDEAVLVGLQLQEELTRDNALEQPEAGHDTSRTRVRSLGPAMRRAS